MAFIIIKDRPARYGRTRAEQESNLRKDGMSTLTDAQLDKLKYIERKVRGEYSVERQFHNQAQIDEL